MIEKLALELALVLPGISDERDSCIARLTGMGLADTPRSGIREVFARLASLGVSKTIMLTGDNQQVVNAVATSVGIGDVRTGLLPEQKLKAIDELMKEYGQVAMVGDGINDAPAMGPCHTGYRHGGCGHRRGFGNCRCGIDGR